MSAPAKIKFSQGATLPPAGEALDGVVAVAVTAVNNDNTDIVSWAWSLEDVPAGSALVVGSLGTVAAMTPFVPDVTGSYLVKLVTTDNVGLVTADYRAVMVKQTATWANRYLPASFARALAETSHNINGQTRGWAPFAEAYLKVIDRVGDVGGAAPADGEQLTWVAANNRWEPGAAGGGAGVPGGAANSVQFNNGGAFGGAGDVLAGAGFISYGAVPAASGHVRLNSPAAGIELIVCRNNADAADIVVVTSSAADDLFFGSDPTLALRRAANTHVHAVTSVRLGAGGTETLVAQATKAVLQASILDLAAAGCATQGMLRAPNNALVLTYRNAGGAADLAVVDTDASDDLFLGTDSGFALGRPPQLHLGASTSIRATRPVLGDTAVSAPWGVHGEVTIDMADANYTAVAAEYAVGIIKNGTATPMTAGRTLTLPDATDANAYYKFIRNLGAFAVTVTNVSAGTSVAVAAGMSAWVGIDAAGAFRMTADV